MRGPLTPLATATVAEHSSVAPVMIEGRSGRRRGSWITARAIPAVSLLVLVIWQGMMLARAAAIFSGHPSWRVAVGLVRGTLYAIFLSVAVVALLLQKPPRARDARAAIRVSAVLASFLLILLGVFAPSGPALLRVSPTIESVALAMTIVGVALAVGAVSALGMNFSFGPQARDLVVRGPYRLVRHPVYLAEILMSSGVLLTDVRLTSALGEGAVIVLQLVRVRAEERLLRVTFPEFDLFASATPHRLIPGMW